MKMSSFTSATAAALLLASGSVMANPGGVPRGGPAQADPQAAAPIAGDPNATDPNAADFSPQSQGQTNGQGWDHTNGPDTTGQPGASCEDPATSTRPGKAETAPGSAFNPDGKAGSVYAGEQPQNSRNTASVSQYDVACAKQPG
jgi:hypothetical protein